MKRVKIISILVSLIIVFILGVATLNQNKAKANMPPKVCVPALYLGNFVFDCSVTGPHCCVVFA